MLDKKRIKGLFLIIFAVLFLISVKLFYIQLISHTRFYKQAANQRYSSVKISNNRGIIYDRNLIPMVNDNPVDYAIVIPDMLTDKNEAEIILKKITLIDDIEEKIKNGRPFARKLTNVSKETIKALEKNNILLSKGYERYGTRNLARHIIGYASERDGHGKAGIEKAYDQFLFSTQGKYIGIVADAVHNSIDGLGVRFIDQRGFKGELNVKLTLDYHIQKIAEEFMDKYKISGAVVALDVGNGDVLAIASRPHFEQNAIEKYINSDGSQLVNRALSAFNVGSVFKIIVSAAGFESGITYTNQIFNCDGYKMVQGRTYRCNSKHEILDLKDAFALSCNSAFIDLGLKIGEGRILDMARAFGFNKPLLLNQADLNEGKGNLPENKYESQKETANISIGQGDILATPLQVAGMIATVANGGVKTSVNLVDSIIDADGKIVKELKYESRQRIISSYTAERLKEMMREVTKNGTGKKADIPQYGGAAGKTGTAQTGWLQDNKTKTHAWFAGYFPIEKPEYALVVFVENGQSGSNVAAPLFGDIAEEIMKLGAKF